jgi:aromatic-L-amino-acid decarboxylase
MGASAIRRRLLHRGRLLDAYASPAAYLHRAARGPASGDVWPCDIGPDLSRGFRALKTWLTFQVYGGDAIGRTISATCELARQLAARVEAEPELELRAPVSLNIVCFRYARPELDEEEIDRLNREIVLALHDAGQVTPSSTVLQGRYTIRAAIVNHRTGMCDIDTLVASVLRAGRDLSHPRSENHAA